MSTPEEALHITPQFFVPYYLHHFDYQTFILYTVMGLVHPVPLFPCSPVQWLAVTIPQPCMPQPPPLSIDCRCVSRDFRSLPQCGFTPNLLPFPDFYQNTQCFTSNFLLFRQSERIKVTQFKGTVMNQSEQDRRKGLVQNITMWQAQKIQMLEEDSDKME